MGDRLAAGRCLVLEDSRISTISETIPGDADRILDVQGRYISPGFVDMHVHGGGGHDFMDGTEAAFLGAARFHLAHGTTLLLPTTVAGPEEELAGILAALRSARRAEGPMPNLYGLHLEGPYLSPAQAGAIDPAHLHLPEAAHVERLLALGGDDIRRVTAACELPGGLALGDALSRRGIVASIGHSDAEYEQVARAAEHGYRHVTHLYSGMSSLRRREARRYLGVTESAYLLDELTVEVIADGMHLPPELLRLIAKCKPKGQISLVTDAMRGAGMPEGAVVKLGSLARGRDVVVCGGVAYLPDFSCFAGSVATADRCVSTMWRAGGVTLPEAVSMMTCNPCRVLGLDGRKGTLAPGFDADLCVFDEEVHVAMTAVGGKEHHSGVFA